MAYSHPLAKVKSRLQIRSHLARQCLAEFLGVFVLMILTQGAVAQAVTSGEGKGNFFTMFLAGSLAVTIAIYVSGNVSGAHLNPAFSLAMCLLGRLPWAKLPIYCLVQLLSAFCASGATYALYYGNVVRSICMWLGVPCSDFEPMKMEILGVPLPCRCPTELYRWEPDSDGPQGDGLHICHLPCPLSVPEQRLPGSGNCEGRVGKAPVFALSPLALGNVGLGLFQHHPHSCIGQSQMTWAGGLGCLGEKEQLDHLAAYGGSSASVDPKVLGTGILIVGILAILDTRNKGVPAGLEPVAVGLLILAIGLSMGANCGFPLNPARDLGPRLFTYVAGWGPEVFSAGNGWWWVPVVAPLVGATLGTATYQLLVALHHSEESEPAQDLEFAQHKASDLEIPASAQCKL
ncbi:unnamed protein product [Nyctereutes procyonoides]|uniref:Aquaporin-3 n=1 Tax=Nyctereutes procyonoides TaxID=34880 RepID=A0A811YHJ1_NYCPR|nr:unnamed protein product [Nyctereutes procyonoides]